MKTELERYKEALSVALDALKSEEPPVCLSRAAKDARKKIDAILNPPPETEEVEVTMYGVFSLDLTKCFSASTQREALCAPAGVETRTLTFVEKCRREKKWPVELSVVVAVEVDRDGYPQNLDFDKHRGFPFRTFPECHGKTGTLTFAWTEPAE